MLKTKSCDVFSRHDVFCGRSKGPLSTQVVILATLAQHAPEIAMASAWVCGGALRAPPHTQGVFIAKFGTYFTIVDKMTPWVHTGPLLLPQKTITTYVRRTVHTN